MISLTYFLLASCFLMGCFANFAGNDYGFDLIKFATAAYTIFLLVMGWMAARKLWGKSRAGSLLLLAECWLVGIGLVGIQLKFLHIPGAALTMIFGFSLAGLVLFFKSISHLVGLRKRENRLACFDGFLVQLFCSIALFTTVAKFQHWPALLGLFAGMPLLVLILISRSIHLLVKSGRQNGSLIFAPHAPSRAFFIILMVGMLHFAGSLAGWVPKFQFLHKPRTMVSLEQQQETLDQQIRLHNFQYNLECFFEKHTNDLDKNTEAEEIQYITRE